MIKRKDILFYKEKGYLKINIFSKKELNNIFSEFQNFLLNKKVFNKNFRENLNVYKNISKNKFKKLMKYNDKIIYLNNLSTKNKVINLIKKLSLKNPILSGNPQFRTDFPLDEIYSQPLHQDILYNIKSKNSLTVWTCLHDCSAKEGALELYEKTHKKKIFKYKKKLNPRRFVISNFNHREFKKIIVETKFGESLIFNQKLVHKSGINSSSKVRLSFQVRFADID